MRRLIKFLHTMGAIGLMGAMACLVVLLAVTPPPPFAAQAPMQLSHYAMMRGAIGSIATWVLLPSLAMTLVAGLQAMAANPGFHNAGWALVKLATGILIFEWGFAGLVGPMQEEAALSASVLAAQISGQTLGQMSGQSLGQSGDIATLGTSLGAEQGSLYVLLAIAALNVILGVWRPRLVRRKARRAGAIVGPRVGPRVG